MRYSISSRESLSLVIIFAPIDSATFFNFSSSRIEFTIFHWENLYKGAHPESYPSKIGPPAWVPTPINVIFGGIKKPERLDQESKNSPSVIQMIWRCESSPYMSRIISSGVTILLHHHRDMGLIPSITSLIIEVSVVRGSSSFAPLWAVIMAWFSVFCDAIWFVIFFARVSRDSVMPDFVWISITHIESELSMTQSVFCSQRLLIWFQNQRIIQLIPTTIKVPRINLFRWERTKFFASVVIRSEYKKNDNKCK